MKSSNASSPKIGILDYGMGNLRSVFRAFIEVGGDARIVRSPREMTEAGALVFPGQGAIVDTMRLLKQSGWDEFIKDWIRQKKPFFGVCLGLQALFEESEEGSTPGLGLFRGRVKRFSFDSVSGLKIPHMGWNQALLKQPSDPLAMGLDSRNDQFYFVHSYYAVPEDASLIWASTQYGPLEFCSAIRADNLIATQFHPEKSQRKGLRLYRNFVKSLD